jgi:hypothetical protein
MTALVAPIRAEIAMPSFSRDQLGSLLFPFEVSKHELAYQLPPA